MKSLWLALILTCSLPALAAPNCVDTTFTTFKETWNQASGDPYVPGGSSVGCQTWALTTGSGQSITTPVGTGWDFTNALKIVHGASAATLTSLGTMPLIPSGSNTTITIEMQPSAASSSSFRELVLFNTPGGSTAIDLSTFTSDGTMCSEAINSCGTNWLINTGVTARNLIVITLNGASSSITVNGTSVITFTAPSQPINQVLVQGDTGTSAADWYYGLVGVANSTHKGGFPPSAFMDMAGLVNSTTVTNTTLASSLHCGNTGTGFNPIAYAAGGSSDSIEGSSAVTIPFPSSLSVCGSSFAGNTGLSLQHHSPSGSAPAAKVTWGFFTNYATVYVGGYIREVTAGNPGRMDQIGFEDGGAGWIGSFCTSTSTTACTPGSTNDLFCVEQEPAGADVGCTVVTFSTWYYLTGNRTASGNDTVSLYNVNQSTGAIGSLVHTFSPVDGAYTPTSSALIFGALGSESPAATNDAYYSNWQAAYADGGLPLGPPAAPTFVTSGPWIISQ